MAGDNCVQDETGQKPANVAIIVVGDLKRAPRVQYTCDALLKQHDLGHLDVICTSAGGLAKSHVPRLGELPNTVTVREFGVDFNWLQYEFLAQKCHFLPSPILLLANLARIAFKMALLLISLIYTMSCTVFSNNLDLVILVNPPLFPAVFIAYLMAKLSRAKFVIDWHNSSHSMLSLQFTGPIADKLIKAVEILEYKCGGLADMITVVSKAMKTRLAKNSNTNSIVVYDAPQTQFNFDSSDEMLDFYKILDNRYKIVEFSDFNDHFLNGTPKPFILTTSSSWSLDDDFQMLLDALQIVDCNEQIFSRIPYLICVMTGQGPKKLEFMENLKQNYTFTNIHFRFPYLDAEHYVKMLAISDVGLSLHASSSKIDLPIKVLDMFGSNLPLLSLKYGCIDELMKDGLNGKLFTNSTELFELIKECIENAQMLATFREYLKSNFVSWETYWKTDVAHHYDSLLNKK